MPEAQAGRFALAFIFLTMLIDTIGLGIIIPVSPGHHRPADAPEPVAARRAGAAGCSSSMPLMQFLCAPLIGNLSDRFGRRPVLILSLADAGPGLC